MSQQILLAIKAQDRDIKRLTGEVNRLKKGIGGIGPVAKLAAGALGAIGVVALAKNVVATTASFQDLRTSLNSVTGSAQAGGQAFEFIKQFSTETQFSVEDLSTTFIKLQSAGIEPTRELLTFFTDTAAITTDQIGSLTAVTDLFARSTAGGLGLEDLNRLADRGVPVFQILQDKLGLARLEITKFAQSAEGSQKVLAALQEGITERFGGATQALLGNLSVQFSNLGIAIRNTSAEFGSELAPAIGRVVEGITNFVVENEELIKSLGTGLNNAILAVVENGKLIAIVLSAAFAAALAVKVVTITQSIITLTKSLRAAAAAGAFFQSITGVGLIKVGAGVAAATAAVIAMNKALGDTEDAQGDLNEETKDGVDTYADYEDGIMKTAKSMKALEEQAEKNAKAQQKLAKEHRKTFDEIMMLNETELQALARQQNEKMKLLNDMLRNRSISEEEFAAARTEIEKKFGGKARQIRKAEQDESLQRELEKNNAIEQDRKDKLELFKQGNFKKGKIEGATQEEMADIAISTAGRTLDILATQNKKFFQLQKAVKIASAIQNTAEGATKAFAQGGMLGFVTAGLIVAAGMAQVAAIRAQNFPGRRVGGPVNAGQPFVVGESGAELFVPQSSGTVVPNDRMGSGAVTVNFNISAVDSSDFDDLLLSRQDLIVSVINRALRERGRAAITA